MRRLIQLLALVWVSYGVADAQTSGQILGKVTDGTGAVLPGVTVTLSGPVLLQPVVAVTSETGSYEFPSLKVSTYSVKFELAGFRTFVHEQIRLEVGFTAQINAELGIAGVGETVEVIGSSPVVDLRTAAIGSHFDAETLQAIPTARDMFHVMEQAPGVAIDRQNTGGTTAGQQSNFMARGASFIQTKWFIDGLDITDSGNGAPYYFDVNSFQEMQVSMGAGDVSVQTPGANVNIVTKSGGDRFAGRLSAFVTDERLESQNVTDAMRLQGATSGNPVKNLQDYGGELGGPIKRGRAWFWGSYTQTKTARGIVNFYQKTGDCAPVAANPLAFPISRATECLQADNANQKHVNEKIAVRLFKGNQFTFRNGFDAKFEYDRLADDLHPHESTQQQVPLVGSQYGAPFWNSGWPSFWKFADQHTFSDRWLLDVSYGHFAKLQDQRLQEDRLKDVQPMFEVSSGAFARSFNGATTDSPYETFEALNNYFLPGKWGGDHSLKAGFKYLHYRTATTAFMGGSAQARFNSPITQPAFSVPFSAQIYRNSHTTRYLFQQSVYLSDSYTHNRVTVNMGIRWDRQNDRTDPSHLDASPFQGQVTQNGTVFNFLPAVDFPGADSGVVWNNFAPRVAVTYDLTGDGKTAVNAAYSQYYDQRQLGQLSTTYSTVGQAFLEFPWTDLTGDKVVQANEINTATIRSFGGGYNPADPTQTVSSNKVDPNIRDPRTGEVVVGFSRELLPDFGMNVSYVWRKYTNQIWQQKIGISSANYSPVTFTPPAGACPTGARCDTVTYYVPNISVPAPFLYTNQQDFYRKYQGLVAEFRKRMAHNWAMTGSFAYNDAPVFYTSPNAYQAILANATFNSGDPTNNDKYNGAQYAPESTAATLSNVFPNARWIARVNGSYRLPWYGIGVAGALDTRQGYPWLQAINIASRPNSAGAIAVLLDPLGDNRLPALKTMDFRVDKMFTFGGKKLQAALDIFNLFNGNTVLAQRLNQNAVNANAISSILGPRVARIGFSLTF